ncbi:unnamed protein product [Acanthosepion pharaonis]|uniref:Uncharacterized protein n=1 Tax=Acanthosepion pharaonis TaxID=158019 RepID=A0A812ARA8_ACAPH|nr:unnamed protein product [Sepia pharaonis]
MGIIPENDTDQDNHPRKDIRMSLQQVLHETNSYIRSFKYALENNTSSDFIVIDADKRPQEEHERRYNALASNEVSVIVSGDQHKRSDIVIESRGSGVRRISETHRSYEALQYPLLFPYGEDGFPIHERFPAIVPLLVHDELRYFSADKAMDVAVRTEDTALTAFFTLCRHGLYCTQTCLHTTCGQKRTPGLSGSAGPTSRAIQASEKTPHSEGFSRSTITTGMF